MIEYSREFKVLATYLNFSVAAKKLNMSQASLSRHISDLERDLAFKLFKRSPVELTPAGRRYLESMSGIIDSIDRLVDQCRQMEKRETAITISLVPWEGPTLDILYAAIALYQEKNPYFSSRFCSDRSLSIRESVECGEADIGVLFDAIADPSDDFACEKISDRHFSAWVHKDNPVLSNSKITFSDMALCYLVTSANRQFSSWLDGMCTACRRFDFEPKIRCKELNTRAEFMLSIKTDEMLLLSGRSDDLQKLNPSLVEIVFDDADCYYSTYFFYRRDSFVQGFVECCLQMMQPQ